MSSKSRRNIVWIASCAALPGNLTGTIIGMAQALGETAPLLMIGMVFQKPNPFPRSVFIVTHSMQQAARVSQRTGFFISAAS
jgi:ABC-type phosphate transport system ATPase subunit